MLPGGFHHSFKIRPVQIPAGESLVLEHDRPGGVSLAKSSVNVCPTHVHLIADAFALAGEAGFPGINGDDVSIFCHDFKTFRDDVCEGGPEKKIP